MRGAAGSPSSSAFRMAAISSSPNVPFPNRATSSSSLALQERGRRIVKRFRGWLVFKAHRILYHSILGSRVIKKNRAVGGAQAVLEGGDLDARGRDLLLQSRSRLKPVSFEQRFSEGCDLLLPRTQLHLQLPERMQG